jgi:hypothetical protein
MMNCLGTCSLCGGRVMAFEGVWGSVLPPPPPRCESCGGTVAAYGPVIPMVPAVYPRTCPLAPGLLAPPFRITWEVTS